MEGRGTSEEIDCRIVYVGPAGSGKSTTLRAVHDLLDPTARGRLLSPARADGSTPFMDLLTVELGGVSGRRLRLQLVSAPGEAGRDAVRQTILTGADGLVFVADSASPRLKANEEALATLRRNLEALGQPALPCVYQYNKRDLPDAIPLEDLERALNPAGQPSFASIAERGEGVVDPLTAVSERLIRALT